MGYARPRAHSPTDVNTDSDKIATTAIKEMFFMFILVNNILRLFSRIAGAVISGSAVIGCTSPV